LNRIKCLGVIAALVLSVSVAEARPRKHHGVAKGHHVSKVLKHKRHRILRHRRPKVAACVVPDYLSDRDLTIRTVIGEARNQSYEGMVAVAAVINNRVKAGIFGRDTRQVVLRYKQFEPWLKRCHYLMSLGPETYGHFGKNPPSKTFGWFLASHAVDEAQRGVDPTNGATHFANVAVVRKRKNFSALRWLARLTGVIDIENHTFGRGIAGSDLDVN
jgi:2-succinyl-5-enolpyruvyl-6-hydroxy-3-cyclohexene-1-carboxylate synthase